MTDENTSNENADERWYEVTRRHQLTVLDKVRVRATSEDQASEQAAERAPEFELPPGAAAGATVETVDRVVVATDVVEEPSPEGRYWIVTTEDEEIWRSTWRMFARSGQEASDAMASGNFESEAQVKNDYEETRERTVTGVEIDPDQSPR